MPIYNSGYFLEIFLEGNLIDSQGEVDRSKKEIIERLREMERKNPKIEVYPKLGISNVIRVTVKDSLPLFDWEEIKTRIKMIIENNKKEE